MDGMKIGHTSEALLDLARADFETTGNGLYAWSAYVLCRSENLVIPSWVWGYLDGVAAHVFHIPALQKHGIEVSPKTYVWRAMKITERDALLHQRVAEEILDLAHGAGGAEAIGVDAAVERLEEAGRGSRQTLYRALGTWRDRRARRHVTSIAEMVAPRQCEPHVREIFGRLREWCLMRLERK